MANTIYDDGVFVVTEAVISTPRRFYPIGNTTATIRRDPLWAAMSLCGFGAACLTLYGDLLYLPEQGAMVAACGASLIAGRAFSILRLDAPLHRRALILARTSRIERLFAALRRARTADGITPVSADE